MNRDLGGDGTGVRFVFFYGNKHRDSGVMLTAAAARDLGQKLIAASDEIESLRKAQFTSLETSTETL